MGEPRVYTQTPGKYLSDGTRLLWAAMEREGLSQEQLRAKMNAAVVVVGRWMRAERRPGTEARVWLLGRFKIPLAAWDEEPKKPFSLPADESGAHPRVSS